MSEDDFAIAAATAGHKLRLRDEEDGGGIDWFVAASGFHNGPGCVLCHEDWCVHCAKAGSIKPCDGGAWHAAYVAKRDRDEWDRLVATYGSDGPATPTAEGVA